MFTIKDIVDFAWKYKGKKAFTKFTYEMVAAEILGNLDNGHLVYVADKAGICGLVIFHPYYATRRLYVHQIVAIRYGFKTLCREAAIRFPDFSIQGKRKGQLVNFKRKHLWEETPQVQVAVQGRC